MPPIPSPDPGPRPDPGPEPGSDPDVLPPRVNPESEEFLRGPTRAHAGLTPLTDTTEEPADLPGEN